MKNILLLFLSLTLFTSCESKLDYEVPNYFTKNDWVSVVSDKDTLWSINKPFKIKNDSVSITITSIKQKEIQKLPEGQELKTMIDKALSECKYSCKNTETYKPKAISIYPEFGDDKDFCIHIRFLASNSFGVPGSLSGIFTYDKNFKLKQKFIF